jgi:hypothetical protein
MCRHLQNVLQVIMNPTELKMQPTIHLQTRKKFSFVLQMYCGLHFQFRRAHFHW